MRKQDERREPVETIGTGSCTGRIYQSDNLTLLSSGCLPGDLKMIYADPPFDVGADFYVQLSDAKNKSQKIVAYSDKWSAGNTYMDMIRPRLEAMHGALADDGCLLFHCDWRLNARVRLLMDEIFGRDNFLNEIIWAYRSGGASRKESLARKHDYILFYRKSKAFRFQPVLERQYLDRPFMESKIDRDGRFYVDTLLRDVFEGELTTIEGNDLVRFNVRPVLNVSSERLGYPTQKPLGLLKLLIRLTTKKGDTVADLFCGSGTTLHAAQSMGRTWIGCDAGPIAVHTTWKRLLAQRQASDKQWQLFVETPKVGNAAEFGLRRSNLDRSRLRYQPSKDIDYWSIDWNYGTRFRNRRCAQRDVKSGRLPELSIEAKWIAKGKLAIDLVNTRGGRTRIRL